jgi:hypothetical protein
MQIEKNVIVTSDAEIKDLMRHITLNELEGQINLTLIENDIDVWQPSIQPVHKILERYPCSDEQKEG